MLLWRKSAFKENKSLFYVKLKSEKEHFIIWRFPAMEHAVSLCFHDSQTFARATTIKGLFFTKLKTKIFDGQFLNLILLISDKIWTEFQTILIQCEVNKRA